ncbi:Uncharacterized protein DBV15_00114 [Temnothorax longispinosus]|uniref:Uncharacterized protein n=1 Tax=Temnothorax longispinosus TaxID=300112 RepID=A0A4V3SA22_9HYME|nr:Uncharacterized protein DBV15_00114 [Temnothorax longispinosus]
MSLSPTKSRRIRRTPERRKLRVCMGFEEGLEKTRRGGDRVQERTGWKDSRPPRGLRYSPDIEMSKPSHH